MEKKKKKKKRAMPMPTIAVTMLQSLRLMRKLGRRKRKLPRSLVGTEEVE
jgi:hypothetical protein